MSYSPPDISTQENLFPGAFALRSYQRDLGFHALTTTNTWPSANLAIYVPVYISQPVTVVKLWIAAATTADISMGIYTEAGTRLVTTGAFAGSNASPEVQDITDMPLARGTYYMGASMDGVGVHHVDGATVSFVRAAGCTQEATAHPVPATMTPVAYTAAFCPLMGFSLRVTV